MRESMSLIQTRRRIKHPIFKGKANLYIHKKSPAMVDYPLGRDIFIQDKHDFIPQASVLT